MESQATSKDLWRLTATEAASLMHKGELKVEDYAKSLLSRIEQRDHQIRAWVHLESDLVLARARELDQIPPDQRGPLHGVAIGVKDIMLTKDMPTQYNSPIYEKDQPITMDAACIITLRTAGALIFGKTTTTEFAANAVANYHQNLTSNPHDLKRTPGGSSSGSAAAVADFHVPVALGTQTGGSVIRPGSFCGTYGFKPTWGAISREGLAQHSMTCDTFGLFTRCVEDLNMLANVFQLADDDPVPSQPLDLKRSKIGFCRTPVWPRAGPGLQKAWVQAQEILQQQGAQVENVELPEDFASIAKWHQNVLDGEGRTSFLGNYLLGKDKLHKQMQGQVENEKKLTRKAQLEAYDGCARLRPVWDAIAAEYDVILTPSVPDEAPVGLEWTGDVSFCSMWSILQVPALNIPGFTGPNGMPIGLTLVGPRYTDRHLLYVAETMATVFGAERGWTRQSS